jgi:hypothetical protein
VPVIVSFSFFPLNVGTDLKNQFLSEKSEGDKKKAKKAKGAKVSGFCFFCHFWPFGSHTAFRYGAVEINQPFCNSTGKFTSLICVLY